MNFGTRSRYQVPDTRNYLRVTRKLEDPEDAEDPQSDERAAEVLVVGDAQSDVVGQDRYHVYDAHDRAHVAIAVGRRVQPQQVLAGEDHYAGSVQTEQFDLEEFAARRSLPGLGDAAARDGLGDVDDDRDGDKEPGNVVEDERRRAGVWSLERTPHPLTYCRLWTFLQRLLLLSVTRTATRSCRGRSQKFDLGRYKTLILIME